MKTYPITDGGRQSAFEIENAYVAPRTIAHLLGDIEGVTDVRARKLFRGSADVHVEFKYRNRECIVWEPFGDSSRYWIGPQEPAGNADDISEIETAFKQYRPPLYRRLVGDVLTFKWVRRFAGRRPPQSGQPSPRL